MKKILKEEWSTNLWLRVLSISSFILIVVGLLIPPIGQIDFSLLTAVGELEFFGVLLIVSDAINKGTSIKASKGDSSIEVSGEKQEE